MGIGLGLLVKFIVETNQTPHPRIPDASDDVTRK